MRLGSIALVRRAWRLTCGVKLRIEASPLYDFECLKVGSIPTVTPIDKQVLDDGNCGRAIDRGEEACECCNVTTNGCQAHSRQSCEATNRNVIQGRWVVASEPTITKPSSKTPIGKSRACAVKVNRLIAGRLHPMSGSRLYAQSRSRLVQAKRRLQLAAEAVLPIRHTPLAMGRAEP